MPQARIIDLSHHNVIPGDLQPAADAGIVGMVHKLTEGTSYIDSKVEARRWLADDAGLAWGLYHFLRPGDPEEQARFFLETAREMGVIDRNTLIAADHEDERVSAEELKAFLDALEEIGDRSPVVYSGHVIKEQLAGLGYRPQRRLWLAQYSAAPTMPEGVEDYWLWQYTDQGEVPGIDPPTDLNTFEGDTAAFLESWSGYFGPAVEPVPKNVRLGVVLADDVSIEVFVNGELVHRQ